MALNLFSASSIRPLCPVAGPLFVPFSTYRWNSTATDSPSPDAPRTGSLRERIPPRNRGFVQRHRYNETSKTNNMNRTLEKYQTRDWTEGDIYAPHDLSAAEMRKFKKRQSPPTDAFDALNLNPLDLYKNFSIMSEYMTSMGRIKHRNETGLRPVNQRKLAKAIRRAIGLGLMPSVHRHPEILSAEAKGKHEGGSAT